jgi:osmotically-inducible protein OsmY
MVSLAKTPASVSDRDLERYVAHCLQDRNVAALRRIAVRAHSGTITLRGTVTSFYQKQLCIQACRDVPGITELVDEVEVDSVM